MNPGSKIQNTRLALCAIAFLIAASAQAQGMGGRDRGEGGDRVEPRQHQPEEKANREAVQPEKNLKPRSVRPNRQGPGRQVPGNVQQRQMRNGQRALQPGNRVQRNLGMNQSRQMNGNQGGRRGAGSNNGAVRTSPSNRSAGFQGHRPEPIRNHNEILNTPRSHSVIAGPKLGPDNRPFHSRMINGAPGLNRMAPLRNANLLNRINGISMAESAHNHYYWHNEGGHRFCHYYDDWGYHWYGWYQDDDFFWTRYYSGRWWWYQSTFNRWCYWHDNAWWWQDPSTNLVFVYNDNAFQPVNGTESVAAVAAPSSDRASQAEYWDSEDYRVVKVFGDSHDAFLYDTSQPAQFNPIFLGSNVQEVKFSKTLNGRSLQVVLTLEDGSFQMFDGNGNPYEAAPQGR